MFAGEKVRTILSKCPTLKTIIYTNHMCGEEFAGSDQGLGSGSEEIVLHSFEDVVELGRSGPTDPVVYPAAESVAVVMYTSGSTGDPKGACTIVPQSADFYYVAGYMRCLQRFTACCGMRDAAGVMLTHSCLVAAMASVTEHISAKVFCIRSWDMPSCLPHVPLC